MSTRFVTLAGFAVLGFAVVGWSVVSVRRPSRVTLPAVMSRITASRWIRLLVVLAWAWLGWHLFARGSGAFE